MAEVVRRISIDITEGDLNDALTAAKQINSQIWSEPVPTLPPPDPLQLAFKDPKVDFGGRILEIEQADKRGATPRG